MRFSKEKIEELKQLVRIELVKNPSASIYTIQEELEKSYNHTFDKNFLAKLKRKVHRERSNLFNENIYSELGQLQNIVRHARQILMEIIFDDEDKHKPSDKIRAFQVVLDAEITLFYAKLNAGIFEKQKKKEKKLTAKERVELDELLEIALKNTRWKSIENKA